MRDVKALITLRSGKKVESPTPKLYVEEKEEEETKKRDDSCPIGISADSCPTGAP